MRSARVVSSVMRITLGGAAKPIEERKNVANVSRLSR